MREGVLEEIQELVARGKLVNAIKRIREETGLSLKEAKEAAEALQRGEPVPASLTGPPPAAGARLTPQQLEQIKRLAEEGELVDAIKSLRAATDLSLKEAKEAVEAMQRGRPVPHLSMLVADTLPPRCASCGAVMGPTSLKWITAVSAECLYCGALLSPRR